MTEDRSIDDALEEMVFAGVHALLVVVENPEREGAFVRALISRRRLNRQLGID